MEKSFRAVVLWAGALLLALAFLGADSAARLALVRSLAAFSFEGRALPATDPASPTGYTAGQHRLILPSGGADGYHWMMQTERMLAGDGLRIRHASYDNPPAGREVHWSGSVRWALAGLAGVYAWFHPGLAPALAIEHVAPWVNALALALFMIASTLLIAWRLGALPAALFAVSCVAVYPFYQSSIVGFLDHHGFAALCAFAAVLFLVIAGSGWTRAGSVTPATARQSRAWLLERTRARHWFIASAIAAAAGLWISAATLVPVLLAIGAAAIVATGLLAPPARAAPGVAPELWRTWGVAGSIATLAFYALEYAPSSLALRLEVIHPLYAVAWLGAGDLLARICGRLARAPRVPDETRADDKAGRAAIHAGGIAARDPGARADLVWLGIDVIALALLPLTIALTGSSTFAVGDAFLWALHVDYITEFTTLFAQLSAMPPGQLLQGTVALLGVPACALLWRTELTGTRRAVWRALVVVLLCASALFLHAVSFQLARALLQPQTPGFTPAHAGVHILAIVTDIALLVALFGWHARTLPPLKPALQAALLLALVPAIVLLGLAFVQVRWLGIDAALWLAVLVTLAAVMKEDTFAWTKARAYTAAVLLAVILLPHPLYAVRFPWRHGYPPIVALNQLLTRDVAYHLRARLGAAPGVVVSGPTTTSWLIYFGGVRGLGTLYWENLDGLKATAEIYGAPTAERAHELLVARGVTHIVICSWDPFVEPYARLARGLRREDAPAPADAFLPRLLRTNELPPWLTRVPYELPDYTTVRGAQVWILEVARPAAAIPSAQPDQPISFASTATSGSIAADSRTPRTAVSGSLRP